MCGITGLYQSDTRDIQQTVCAMSQALVHRGPDDSGIWCDKDVGIAFGFRRLAIIDLTSAGHQPMRSATGRYVIVFNGEIYNFLELKRELIDTGCHFCGGSDTEVMLAAFETWGIEISLKKFNGMYSFAVWDSEERILTLARDRIGKKPLYYGWSDNCFLFCSELKSLKKHPKFYPEVDRDALAHYVQVGYIPYPLSIYKGIYKLIPGSILQLDVTDMMRRPIAFNPYLTKGGELGPKSYWSLLDIAARVQNNPYSGTEDQVLTELDKLIHDATRKRMISDVPLGAFLSGGIDSSLVVAIMQSEHNAPVKTFTIGFDAVDYNEATFAKMIAEHLKTDHTELYLSADDSLKIIPNLPQIYDEPLADASQIPTFLVSKLARESVTVALCGDGGDELFVGYNRYIWPERILSRLRFLPISVREILSKAGHSLSVPMRHRIARLLSSCLPRSYKLKRPEESFEKLLNVLTKTNADDIYKNLTTYWTEDVVLSKSILSPQYTMKDVNLISDFILRSMFLDLGNYLPEDLLAKVDRASMAASIEVRAPLLDYRLIEFAASIPTHLRAKNGEKKYLLRTLLGRYLPKELFERPKMGFSVPIGRWLSGPLNRWAEDLLDETLLSREGYFNPSLVRSRWKEQCSGTRNWQNELWTILVFQAWNQSQKMP